MAAYRPIKNLSRVSGYAYAAACVSPDSEAHAQGDHPHTLPVIVELLIHLQPRETVVRLSHFFLQTRAIFAPAITMSG